MGRVYDCRRDGREPGSVGFPCNVRILDAATGERIANVFYAQTAPAKLGRFVSGPGGEPLVDARTRRRVPAAGPGGRRAAVEYDRLEVWEVGRRWVAVSVATGEVVEKSEGVP